MSWPGLLECVAYLVVLLLCVKPLGWYIAQVFLGRPCGLDRLLGGGERWLYRLIGTRTDQEMNWREYAEATLLFSLIGTLSVYLLQRLQFYLPLNPQQLPAVPPDLAFNTAASFVSNTNWQSYSGETTLSALTQMLSLTVQNFVSAATGMAVLSAFLRGLTRRSAGTIGNFWVDLTRSTLYVLLPLSTVLTVALISQGVVQALGPYQEARILDSQEPVGREIARQVLPVGPAASQIAIKQLGTNGGGFFGTNSAHPFENPTPLSNFLQCLALLLIPAALCGTFGYVVRDRRQGWAVLAAMLVIFLPLLAVCVRAEQSGNPALSSLDVDQRVTELQSGGNLEGKEVRFGPVASALWAAATTAVSNGSVNSMHDSFTPLGGLVPMWLMQVGEVVFGGVGSGLYGMLMFAIMAVFIAGLMVGRTPEYLGKKIDAFEMKMAVLTILIPPLVVLGLSAVSVLGPGLSVPGSDGEPQSLLTNSGAHGLSEILYAYSSAGNNNGSAFAGLNANVPFHNLWLGVAMLVSRFWLIIPVLAMAGSLAGKKAAPVTAGTLPTHTPLFVLLLVAVVVLVGALTFLPSLALGPIVEHLQMISR